MNRCSVLGAVVSIAVGCGGTVIGGHSGVDAGGGDGPGGDSANDAMPNEAMPNDATPIVDGLPPWSPVCPGSAPAMGSPCSIPDGTDCEYDCNVLVCSGGMWAGAIDTVFCPTGANPPSCPGTLSAITPGAVCASTGDVCVYATGSCECDAPSLPTPGGMSMWRCGPVHGAGGAGVCPFPRPRLGSACSTPGSNCQYEQCGSDQVCKGGYWQSVFIACGA